MPEETVTLTRAEYIQLMLQARRQGQGLLAYESTSRVSPLFTKEEILQLFYAADRLPMKHSLNDNDWSSYFVKERNKTILVTQYLLGLRNKEALALRFDDFKQLNEDEWEIFIRGQNNKTGKDRTLPVPQCLMHFLDIYLSKFPHDLCWGSSPFLFPSRNGEHLSASRWNRVFNKILREAGLMQRHPTKPWRCLHTAYSLRHTRATEMLDESNDDLWLVANALGHGSVEVTKTYLHRTKLFRTRMKDVLERSSLSP